MKGLSIVVIGCGSIGQRHLRNLAAIPEVTRLSAVDPDGLRRQEAAAAGATPFATLEEALAHGPDAVVVATPTYLHLEGLREALAHGCHALVEKPIAMSCNGVAPLLEQADRTKRLVMMGNNLRFHPAVQELWRLMRAGEIGQIVWARAEYGWYLPNWRPTRDHRETYSARRDQGGGVLLDVCHEIDLMHYLLGKPATVLCITRNTGVLGTDVDEVAALICSFEGGVMVELHLDCIQRSYCRTSKVVGTEGTAIWDYPGGKLAVFRAQTGSWEERNWEGFTPEHAYQVEMQQFIAAVRGGARPDPNGWDGLRTLRLVEAAARSALTGCRESI